MLEKMPGGVFHFEIAEISRNALLSSSILSHSEVWYGVTKIEVEQLEQIDEMLLQNIFSCSRNIPKDLLYLKMGLVPISFNIKRKTPYVSSSCVTGERSEAGRGEFYFSAQSDSYQVTTVALFKVSMFTAHIHLKRKPLFDGWVLGVLNI